MTASSIFDCFFPGLAWRMEFLQLIPLCDERGLYKGAQSDMALMLFITRIYCYDSPNGPGTDLVVRTKVAMKTSKQAADTQPPLLHPALYKRLTRYDLHVRIRREWCVITNAPRRSVSRYPLHPSRFLRGEGRVTSDRSFYKCSFCRLCNWQDKTDS